MPAEEDNEPVNEALVASDCDRRAKSDKEEDAGPASPQGLAPDEFESEEEAPSEREVEQIASVPAEEDGELVNEASVASDSDRRAKSDKEENEVPASPQGLV